MKDAKENNYCNCCETEDAPGLFWEENSFRLCFNCLETLYKQYILCPSVQKTSSNKKYISKELRWKILERDNFTCQICGSRRYLEIDHIIPESIGGELKEENLQILCKSCNCTKGAKH